MGGRKDEQRSTSDGTAGALVQQRVALQVAELTVQDAAARNGDELAVHDLRVAARRLRSLLATYRRVLDRTVTDPVRDELRWLGGETGAARDAHVQRARLLARLDAVPEDLVLGPVRRRVDLELRFHERAGIDRMRCALRSPRHDRLLHALGELGDALPFTDAAQQPAAELVPRVVGRQVRRVEQAARAVDGCAPAGRDAALHEVRKAAKRARYAAESATEVAGSRAVRLMDRMRDLQELLGEHQDAVTARALLRDLGAAAYAAAENGFTFGVLGGLEDVAAAEARAGYPKALWRATRSSTTSWAR